jgi:hypothetical protein
MPLFRGKDCRVYGLFAGGYDNHFSILPKNVNLLYPEQDIAGLHFVFNFSSPLETLDQDD